MAHNVTVGYPLGSHEEIRSNASAKERHYMYFSFGKVTSTCLTLRLDLVHVWVRKDTIEYAEMRNNLGKKRGDLYDCLMNKIQYPI